MEARVVVGSGQAQPYFRNGRDFTLYRGDALELLEAMEAEQFDMVFADPPYFLSNDGVTCQSGRMVSVNKGRWDRSQGVHENHAFNLRWLGACQRLLKPNGTIWVSGTHHVIYSLGFAMQTLGYKILNDIAWYKVNPPPNLSCRYFTHGTETLVWAARDERSRHTFNYATMRERNGGKQMQSLWQIMAPRKGEKLEGRHPTQKPLELLERIVLASTQPGEHILDPFSGSATTGIAALAHGRSFVGIEREEEYLDLSIRRFQALTAHGDGAAAGAAT